MEKEKKFSNTAKAIKRTMNFMRYESYEMEEEKYWRKNIDELLKNGSDVNVPVQVDKTGLMMHALMMASSHGDIDLVLQLLVDCGADVNIQSDTGFTALMFACVVGNPSMVSILIQLGADENKKNVDGDTAFDMFKYTEMYEYEEKHIERTKQSLKKSLEKRDNPRQQGEAKATARN